MGVVTKRFPDLVDCVVTEGTIYAMVGGEIQRLKIHRALWDTGASATLVSEKVVKSLSLSSVGKSGVSGYNFGIDIKDTFLIHLGLPTGDIITNVYAMEFDGEDYDLVIGMDVIGRGDFALTNQNEKTTFSFRIPSVEEIDFSSRKP